MPQRCHLPIYQPPVWPSHCPIGVHKSCERSQTHSSTSGDQTTPISGRLVNSSSFQTGLHRSNTESTKAGERPRVCSKPQEVRTCPLPEVDFLGYHFLLDMALVKPTQDRWTKLQEMFHRLSMKFVISARTLMSTTGLLASMEKTVKLGRIHKRPFQWHLKTHWRYPMPLDTPITWNQKIIQHETWWLDPQNVLQGEFLHPREHKKLIFTDASNAGWGTHLNQASTGGLWSQHEKHLHINLLELKAVFLAL